MKLLLDQNLSRRLISKIEDSYPGSIHVADVGLDAASDRSIWEWAGERGYVVVSKDTDFRQLAFLYGPPPKVVWLRVGNVSTSMIEALLQIPGSWVRYPPAPPGVSWSGQAAKCPGNARDLLPHSSHHAPASAGSSVRP